MEKSSTNTPAQVQQLVDHLFRHESGKMIAVLSKLLGLQHLATAQDIVQDTLLQAMNTWSYGGIPDNPPAWLYRVAKNKAVDALRREKKFRVIGPDYARQLQSEYAIASAMQQLFLEREIQDSQLRMMFACCHPAIPPESQIALVLKTLCGLSISEIANAFLISEDTISKRIYRAKEKIRTEKIELEVPQQHRQERTDTVLKCLYLLFSEGYNSSHPSQLIREDLCHEAMRLCQLLNLHPLPRGKALMALFCFQASRLTARLDEEGNIILLRHQDRTKWFRPLIQKGFAFLQEAAEPFEVSVYHLEATIASLHANAACFEDTDWKNIYRLYVMLNKLEPGPVIALHKTIACLYALGAKQALAEWQQVTTLADYYLYHAVAGEIYLALQEKEKARDFFVKAQLLTRSQIEKKLLQEKIRHC